MLFRTPLRGQGILSKDEVRCSPRDWRRAQCGSRRNGACNRAIERGVVQIGTMFPCLDELKCNSQSLSMHLDDYLESAAASRKLGTVMLEHCRASVLPCNSVIGYSGGSHGCSRSGHHARDCLAPVLLKMMALALALPQPRAAGSQSNALTACGCR